MVSTQHGYILVDPNEQAENASLDAQKSELLRFGILEEHIHIEIGAVSQAIQNRPVCGNLINQILKEGDTLVITKINGCLPDGVSYVRLKKQLAQRAIVLLVLHLPPGHLINYVQDF